MNPQIVAGAMPMAAAILAACFLACVVANRKDRREGYQPTAPSALMAVMFLWAVASAVLSAETLPDPCSLVEPSPMFSAAWWAWWAAGCFWNG